MAYIAPSENILNVWIKTIGKDDDFPLTNDRRRGIQSYFWAENSQQILYIQDKEGDENWHIFLVPLKGGEPRNLTPLPGVQARIIATEPQHPDTILVALNHRNPQFHDVFRVNLKTGERTLDVQNDLGAIDFTADHNLTIRTAQVPTPTGGNRLMHRANAHEPWEELLTWDSEDSNTTSSFGFAADNETLYMISSIGSNTAELRTLNVRTKETKKIAAHPDADVSDVLIHPLRHTIEAVSFTKERKTWQVIDPSVTSILAGLQNLHPGDFNISSRDHQDQTWIVSFSQDKGSAVYYSVSRQTEKGTFLFSTQPKLDGLPLAEMKPVSFKARDGLLIHAYLTLPIGKEPKNIPVVINVHGGPWHRETWGYDAEAQWFANRGYACFQINFRGSTGYGKDFINAGDREWGGKMQDDITDGAHWLISEGIADPKKIAIYGGSYGGYAVLSGLTKTPDLYACGVDIVGPSNLITLINSIPPYWEPLKVMFCKRVGHPEKDEKFLKERSPLFHVDKIKAPLFIAQGANDPRVKRQESIQMRDALVSSGRQIEYLEFPDEGHGFVRPENRIKFYAAAEKFLAVHLGGRSEKN